MSKQNKPTIVWHLSAGDEQKLKSSRTPHLHVYQGELGILYTQLKRVGSDRIVVNGTALHGAEGILDEFGRALSFPDYFGHNLDALWDCLTDLSWLDKKSLLLVIENADFLLNAPDEAIDIVIEYLRDAGISWAIPVMEGNGTDHGTIPFNVIFHVTSNSQESKFKQLLADKIGDTYWDTLNAFWNYNWIEILKELAELIDSEISEGGKEGLIQEFTMALIAQDQFNRISENIQDIVYELNMNTASSRTKSDYDLILKKLQPWVGL